ncbi:hypothetical protein [Ohtaekwangia koreensis]|uniref:hypothetical protein n=1 Tax=Ohtaekwangia koreensis TaxID=688867 RepID=UPI0009A64E39|nr:hypothetical protein [Ohtaekwangia koreensis]
MYASCYRVSAIDAEGAEGPSGEAVSNDNCPYRELPNVFTPMQTVAMKFFSVQYEMNITGI